MGVSKDTIDEHRNIALQEMQKVYKLAKEAPWPSVDLALADVQDSGDPREGAF